MLCEKFGDYCLDLSKLIFGGVILAAIMQLDINTVWLFVVGTVIVALVVIIWGNARIAERRLKKIIPFGCCHSCICAAL